MANNKEYKEGYDAAIEAIKKALSGQDNGGSNNSSSTDDGRDMDLSGTPAGDKLQDQNGNSNMSDNGSGNGGSGSGGSGNGSEDSSGRGNGDQGTVTPEDCAGQFGDDIPSTPGGFMSANEGNKLANAEGYDSGPTDDAIANGWKEAAIQQATKGKGNNAGKLYSKILGLWRTSTDWKKAFRKIIGRSLNTQDKRQAYANKNVLATRNMVARTDKDKFDAVDYMCIFTDSSGSISDSDLKYMLSEIYSIAYQLKPEVLVVGQFDTQIQDIKTFHDVREFQKYSKTATVKGRGGTDCKCIWDILKNDKKFKGTSSELVIIMTDGYLTPYKRDPKTMNHLCWVIVDNPGWNCPTLDNRTYTVHLNSKDVKKR